MGLLPVFGTLKQENTVTKPKMGIVIDVDDPLQIGRVKATVEGMYTKETAVWIRPMTCLPFGANGKNKCEVFFVPELGTKIWIEFPFGDENFPYYTSVTPFGKFSHTEAFKENYPHECGFVYGEDFIIKFDTDKGIFFMKNGKTSVTGKIGGDIFVVGENIDVLGNKTVKITGTDQVDIKSSKVVNVNGTNSVNIKGDSGVTVQSNASVMVKGSSVNVNGGTVTIGNKTIIDNRVFLEHKHPYSWTHDGGSSQTGGVV